MRVRTSVDASPSPTPIRKDRAQEHGITAWRKTEVLDPVSSHIHVLHGMTSWWKTEVLDPVSSAIHGLHGMTSS